jgi:hypothetical protein
MANRAAELAAVSELIDDRTCVVTVLADDPTGRHAVESCMLGALGGGAERILVDLSSVFGGVSYELLMTVTAVQRQLAERGVRAALVCRGPDVRVLELGQFGRTFVLATTRRGALERLGAKRAAALAAP